MTSTYQWYLLGTFWKITVVILKFIRHHSIHKSIRIWKIIVFTAYAKRAFQSPTFTIKTPAYKLAKRLGPTLSDITQNEITIKDSLNFAFESLFQGDDLDMAGLDIDFVFTNIPLNDNIDICIDKFFRNPEALVNKISRNLCRRYYKYYSS